MIYTPEEIALMDAEEVRRGRDVFRLVDMAGEKIAQVIQKCHPSGRALFFCGPGNNGADGLAAARHLPEAGQTKPAYECRALLFGQERMSPSSLRHLELAREAGAEIIPIDSEDELTAATEGFGADIAVDALLGTGATRFPQGLMESAVQRICNMRGAATVYAIDVPTGVLPASGQVSGSAVRADMTIALQGLKPGLILYPGADYAGKLNEVVAFQPSYAPKTQRYIFTDKDVLSMSRPRHSHKGDYGRLGIIAGSRGLSGAGALCARAALRSGCGLLSIASPASTAQLYAGMIPEAMTCGLPEEEGGYGDCAAAVAGFLSDKDVYIIGPGMGRSGGVLPAVRAALESGLPMVVDADALNALAAADERGRLRSRQAIITPHPAELARLMGVDISAILDDPLAAAEGLAREYGIVCVLKLSTTIIASPGRTAFVLNGCAGMAKGGSGDVLAGCMGGLLAGLRAGHIGSVSLEQRGGYLHYAACAAALACGSAGELAQKRLGATYMLPSDEIESLSAVFKSYEL